MSSTSVIIADNFCTVGEVYNFVVYNLNSHTESLIARLVSVDENTGRVELELLEESCKEGCLYKYHVKMDDIVAVHFVALQGSNLPMLPLPTQNDNNEGGSDYHKYKIQAWDIWEEYNLNPWDADIIKRVLRTKKDASMTADEQRVLDYKKIIHVCRKRIEMLS